MSFILEAYAIEAIRDGRFSFMYGPHPLLALLLLLIIPLVVWLLYRRTTRPLTPRWKALLVGLRSAMLILLLLILMRPVISTWQVNPQETYLAVLVDDSASMQINDLPGGLSRRDAVSNALFADNGIVSPLSDNFQVRVFAFDKTLRRVSGPADLQANGNLSDLDHALAQVAEQLGGLPLSAVVLISDGADNSDGDLMARARDFAARQIAVYSVGVGQSTVPRDVSITEVSAASTILDNSIYEVQVNLTQQGYAGQSARLRVWDADEEVLTQTVVLGPDGASRRFDLELTPERREPILYELQVDAFDGELILQNNRYQFLVDNSERPPLNILYVEGHPRNEFKFIRRAVEGDQSLRLASYLQTGPGRFYRQGINSPLELSGGFPSRAEDLYQYEAVVIGDISRDFLSDAQLQLLQDFVSERGGGLMVSGALDDAFVDTVLADMLPLTTVRSTTLPVFLQGGVTRGAHATGELYSPRLTPSGEFSAMLRLSSDDAENRRLWSSLPQLQGVHVTGRPKPGATVLMEHPLLQYQNQALAVLATQRYGSGRSMSVATPTTWRWQMLMPSSDDSHARLWRQMLRWLAQGSLERVSVNFDKTFYNEGDTVSVAVLVRDERYHPDNNASVWLQRSDPDGSVTDMQLEWDISEDGLYRTRFVAGEQGVYRALVDVSGASASIDKDKQVAFVVTPSLREFNNAGRDDGLLGRLAENSGGRHYDLAQISQLADDLVRSPGAYSREVQEDLWDKPFWLLVLIVLMCADWMARRFRGLS
jgi:hypothetical protein